MSGCTRQTFSQVLGSGSRGHRFLVAVTIFAIPARLARFFSLLNGRTKQDSSWEVQAQLVVASCAVLDAFPHDASGHVEEKATLLSIISVR